MHIAATKGRLKNVIMSPGRERAGSASLLMADDSLDCLAGCNYASSSMGGAQMRTTGWLLSRESRTAGEVSS